ncbi:MAG: HDOD domain-containing protein [Candidatus Hydrogenedentes bacterium]|nr:HDOD domain-containing protein [Candidatus Hydrogenedentota bacterium]
MPDVRDEARRGSAAFDVFAHLYGAIHDLPVLPSTPQRVIAMVHDPLSDMEEIAKIVNEDAGLALRVLRIANSALYGGLHEIRETREACARLGMKVVANTMWAIMGNSLYRRGANRHQEWIPELWRHAIAVAHCAESVATCVFGGSQGVEFVAGLTHDIGKVVLLDVISQEPTPQVAVLAQSEMATVELLNRFHALAGLHVVQHMGLPHELGPATLFHHRPEAVPFAEDLPGVHILSLADRVVHVLDGEGPDACLSSVAEHPAVRALGMDNGKLGEILEAAFQRLDAALDAYAA